MEIKNETRHGLPCISIIGRIDGSNAAGLEKDLLDYVKGGNNRIVLDLSALEYISSAGLRVVLVLAKCLNDNQGKLALCALQEQVREIFEMCGFVDILTIVDTPDMACMAVLEG
jgi:stage II sporulation protein AA (anti-sigma F factor antagonist)